MVVGHKFDPTVAEVVSPLTQVCTFNVLQCILYGAKAEDPHNFVMVEARLSI
jgi:hypothetical protein